MLSRTKIGNFISITVHSLSFFVVSTCQVGTVISALTGRTYFSGFLLYNQRNSYNSPNPMLETVKIWHFLDERMPQQGTNNNLAFRQLCHMKKLMPNFKQQLNLNRCPLWNLHCFLQTSLHCGIRDTLKYYLMFYPVIREYL